MIIDDASTIADRQRTRQQTGGGTELYRAAVTSADRVATAETLADRRRGGGHLSRQASRRWTPQQTSGVAADTSADRQRGGGHLSRQAAWRRPQQTGGAAADTSADRQRGGDLSRQAARRRTPQQTGGAAADTSTDRQRGGGHLGKKRLL